MATSIPPTTTTEPFPPLEATPTTPTSCVSASAPSTLPTISELAEISSSSAAATAAATAATGQPPLSPLSKPNALQLPALNNPAAVSSPKFTRLPYSPARSPIALTGVAAVADARRKQEKERDNPSSRQTTPNPAVEAMHSLMGGGGMSRPTDAPSPTKLSEPMRNVAEKLVIPENNNVAADSLQTSPVSMSSFGTADHTNGNGGALTATSGSTSSIQAQFASEPAEQSSPNARPAHQVNSDEPRHSANSVNKPTSSSSTYPGPPSLTQQQHHLHQQPPQNQVQHDHQRTTSQDSTPARGMSLPGLSYNNEGAKSSPASGTKRHKCPYCSTDFTRHHNLKSHLLTHSQEKPYVCHTCQARFRRLHDLKRHARLHTGERPHTCDKCGRSFARGDALARHNKGTGGCSGPRTSIGGDGDNPDGVDGMDGVEYGVDEDGDDSMADAHARRVSEPSRKRIHLDAPHASNIHSPYRQHSSTYPPGQHRPGDMGPPAVVHSTNNNNNSQSTSPRDTNAPSNSYYSGFGQHTGGMTESPKPLSPGHPPESNRLSIDAGTSTSITRNRSPSLTTQFQQTHFGRGNGGRTPPQPSQFQNSTQLPPLTLGTSASRPALHSNHSGPGPSMLHHQQVPSQSGSMSNPASASSYGQSSGSSMREILGGGPTNSGNGNGGSEADIWAHIRQLEGKFSRMQDEYELRISRLQEEVISLRGQLNSVTSGAVQGSYPGEPRY